MVSKQLISQLSGQRRIDWDFPAQSGVCKSPVERKGWRETMWRDQKDSPCSHSERAVMGTHMDQSEPGQDQMARNGTCDWVAQPSQVRIAPGLLSLVPEA